MTPNQIDTTARLMKETVKWMLSIPQRDLIIQTNKARYYIAPNGDVVTVMEALQ